MNLKLQLAFFPNLASISLLIFQQAVIAFTFVKKIIMNYSA